MKDFVIVEYLQCPYCSMTFDPKNCVVYQDTESTGIKCRFCKQVSLYHSNCKRERRV